MSTDSTLNITHLMTPYAAKAGKGTNLIRASAQIGILFSREIACAFPPECGRSLHPRERRRLRPLEGAAVRGTARSAPEPPEDTAVLDAQRHVETLSSFAAAAARPVRKRLGPGLELQKSHILGRREGAIPARLSSDFLCSLPPAVPAHLTSLPHLALIWGSRLRREL